MSPIAFSPAILICVLLVLSLSGTTMSFPPGCVQTLDCGPLKNLSYPFTSLPNCSPPEFLLRCDNDSAQLTISSVTYRVLHVDQTSKTMTLARSDLWDTACPLKFTNSTMNSSVVGYASDNEDLTIFYGCPSGYEDKAYNQFYCSFYGIANLSYAYYLTGPVPTDPILSLIHCSVGVPAKIQKTAASELKANQSTLQEVLMKGFDVKYIDLLGETCLKCPARGKECGFDPKSGQPTCLCGNQTCDSTGSRNQTLLTKVLLPISISMVVALSFIIIYMKRLHFPISLMIWERDRKHDELNNEEIMKNFASIGPKRYTYSDVKKLTNSFKDKVGQGGYGIVYKGKLFDGRVVAVKILNESKGNGEEFINEVVSICRTSHINVVNLLGFCYERTRRALIYELRVNGSLDKLICDKGTSTPNSHLDSKTMFQIAIGIARGLGYLHRGCNTRILHFDIKPHNILLDEDLCPKISDFGLAKLCKPKESIVSMTGMRGTIGYIAPEVFNRYCGKVSHKSDVYSYGMLVLEMNRARKIANTRDSHWSEVYFPHGIYKKLDQGESFGIFEDISEEEEDIIKKMIIVGLWCIQINPSNRPSMGEVIEMLEGTLQSLQVPPKPSFDQPISPTQDFSTTSLSQNLTFEMHSIE